MYNSLKRVDVFLVYRLHAKHNVAIHLHKAAVAVVSETLVAGLLGQSFNNVIVETEVKDGVHHARHGCPGARAHADEKRVVHVAKLAVHEVFDMADGLGYIVFEQSHYIVLTFLKIFIAHIGSDCKSGRYRYADEVHFGQVCSLTSKQIPHICPTLGFTVAEGINSFFIHKLVLFMIDILQFVIRFANINDLSLCSKKMQEKIDVWSLHFNIFAMRERFSRGYGLASASENYPYNILSPTAPWPPSAGPLDQYGPF